MVTFYRGGWCPYCNVQLRAYQQVLGEITRLGAKLVAISPQLPNGSMSTAEVNRLSFDVLGDIGNRVARSFGLVYSTAAGNCRCPRPTSSRPTARSRAEIELDYRERLEPDAIVAAASGSRNEPRVLLHPIIRSDDVQTYVFRAEIESGLSPWLGGVEMMKALVGAAIVAIAFSTQAQTFSEPTLDTWDAR